MRKVASLVLALSVAVLAAPTNSAEACGGCLAPTDTVTNVNAHRMVVALSPERTILWDQIRYEGDPRDFVWVLPVPSPDTTIELAASEFFDELEGNTAPQISPQALPLSGGGPSIGCGGAADSAESGSGGSVTVYDQQVVGPYETVTIGSEDPDALYQWLIERDYQITDETAQTMDEYIADESIFVVLRLAPDEGTEAMQPVRITYPGYMATFPLKMVKVGARSDLELSLWIIAEQRYEALNYANATVRARDLTYDWSTGTSDYQEQFLAAIDNAGGRAWVTEYAGAVPYLPVGETELTAVRQDIPYPYLTRIRTDMRLEYLTDDLNLGPAADPSDLSNFMQAGTEIDRPENSDDGCQTGSLGRMNVLAFAGLAALLALSRRRRMTILGRKRT